MKALLKESKVTKNYSYGSETPLPLLGPLRATVKSSYASTSAQLLEQLQNTLQLAPSLNLLLPWSAVRSQLAR